MATPQDQENLRAVFGKILKANQLSPKDLKKELSKIHIHDKGRFDCWDCGHKWESKFSWITFDLIELEITYRWKMKCRMCLMPYIPTFSVDQVEAMFEKAVRRYKGEEPRPVDIGYNAHRERPQPHLPVLCEKCRWGTEICWQRRNF